MAHQNQSEPLTLESILVALHITLSAGRGELPFGSGRVLRARLGQRHAQYAASAASLIGLAREQAHQPWLLRHAFEALITMIPPWAPAATSSDGGLASKEGRSRAPWHSPFGPSWGLRWKAVGAARPVSGRELTDAKLLEMALADGKASFTRTEYAPV